MSLDRVFQNLRSFPVLGIVLASPALSQTNAPAAPPTAERPFLADNDAAMNQMMNGMAIEPTGDVDADFTAMMIPHHQGAIAMAQAELRWGRNEQLRRIAQEIIIEHGQEIVAMRLALGQPLPASAPAQTGDAPTSVAPLHPAAQASMHMDHTR